MTGRIFAVFYALIGIPLTLVVISGVGRSLAGLGERTGGCSRTSCTCICLKGLVVIVLGLCFVVTLPALMYYKVENRPFSDAWWFSFFTVTTVGLGEVPGKFLNKYVPKKVSTLRCLAFQQWSAISLNRVELNDKWYQITRGGIGPIFQILCRISPIR